MLVRIVSLLIGYAFGLFQTSYIYGRKNGIDIREHGSGNAGTTNALRTLGKKAGAVTLLGDCLKCALAILAVYLLFGRSHPQLVRLLELYAGAGCILGHNFPFYLHFKGGKGIATTGGVIFAFDWRLGLLCLLIFSVVTGISKYVSLGSICMVLVIPFILYFSSPHDWQLVAVGCVFTAMAVWRHRANIGRLIHGTENKLGQKVKR